MISIKIIAFFLKIWEKVMLVVTMATDVAIKIFTIIFLVLGGNDHSVKVSSNSGSALWEFFGFLRELVLNAKLSQEEVGVSLKERKTSNKLTIDKFDDSLVPFHLISLLFQSQYMYSLYKKKRKHDIIFNNLRIFKDEHFKLTGELDWHVPYQ